MICAQCAEATDTEPCSSCGASPTVDGRYRLAYAVGKSTEPGDDGTFSGVRAADGIQVALTRTRLRAFMAQSTLDALRRNVDAVAALRGHLAVPAHIDAVLLGDGEVRQLWIVREWLDGIDLWEDLGSHRYSLDQGLDLVHDALAILAVLHDHGVVHGDVRPGNIRIRPDGKVALVGPAHIGEHTTPQEDVYAIGELAALLLTRRRVDELRTPDGQIDWKTHAGVTMGVGRFLEQLLAADPELRPRSAREALLELELLRSAENTVPTLAATFRAGPEAKAAAPSTEVFEDSPTAALFGPEHTGPSPVPDPPGPTAETPRSRIPLVVGIVLGSVLALGFGVGAGLLFLGT